jgi:hypothetical protein
MKNSQWYSLWGMLVFLQSNDAALLHKPNLDTALTVISIGFFILAFIWCFIEHILEEKL